jgi:hypothetical protein
MAIAQLATGRVEATERPRSEPKVQNERVEKKSSSMFEESDFGGLVIMLSDLTTQLARINEAAKKTVLGINKAIKSLKDLGKTIVKDFRGLNSEIAASRVNLSGLALGGETIIEGAPMPVAPITPEIKAGTPAPAPGPGPDVSGILSGMLTALGLTPAFISGLKTVASFFLTNPLGIGLLAGSLVAYGIYDIIGGQIRDYNKKLGITDDMPQEEIEKRKRTFQAERKEAPYREMTQQTMLMKEIMDGKHDAAIGITPNMEASAADRIRTKIAEDVSNGKIDPRIKKTPVLPNREERRTPEPGFTGDAGNLVPQTLTQPSAQPPAQAAPAGPKLSPAERSRQNRERAREEQSGKSQKAPVPPQSSAPAEGAPSTASTPVDPEIAAKAAQYKEMGRKGIPLPDNIASDPLVGKLAITAHKEGMDERNAGAPQKLDNSQGDGDRSFGSSEQQTNEALSYNPVTGEKLKGTGNIALRARARGQVLGQAAREDKAGFAKISTGVAGEDYSEANKTLYIDRDIGGQKVQVPIYYNPVTDKQYSPEAGIRAAERTRPEMLRGRMEQFDRQQDVDALRRGEEMRMRGSVRPLEPVVMNNSSTTNVGSSSGGETNNVSGQNLPMEVSNPALQPFLARQNVHYQ